MPMYATDPTRWRYACSIPATLTNAGGDIEYLRNRFAKSWERESLRAARCESLHTGVMTSVTGDIFQDIYSSLASDGIIRDVIQWYDCEFVA